MDTKDHPPPYPGTHELGNPVAQTAYPPPGQAYPPPGQAYPPPGQTNYGYAPAPAPAPGYAPQPVFQQPMQQQQQQQSVIVQTGGTTNFNAPPIDHTTSAWLACLLCFWPTGLIAIMRASESRDALARGDMAGAHMAADGARQMIRVSYIIGIISVVLVVIILVVLSVLT